MTGNPGFCAFVRGRRLRQMLVGVPVGTVLAVVLILPCRPVTAVGWLVYLAALAGVIGLGWLYCTIEMWAREQAAFPLELLHLAA